MAELLQVRRPETEVAEAVLAPRIGLSRRAIRLLENRGRFLWSTVKKEM
jgi:hypothetical protein